MHVIFEKSNEQFTNCDKLFAREPKRVFFFLRLFPFFLIQTNEKKLYESIGLND